jgi:hypothetical protein
MPDRSRGGISGDEQQRAPPDEGVILLAVSLDLLRQDVAASRNNERNMQRETPPGRRPVALYSFHGGMNEVAAAHRLPRHGMGELAHRPG